jgi:hypothetical protein
MEFISPLPFVKIDLGRSGSNKIYGYLLRGRIFLPWEKEGIPSKSFFLDGKTSKKTVAEQDEEMPEGKLRVFRSKGKGRPLLSSERFPSRRFETESWGTSSLGGGKTFGPGQILSGDYGFHIGKWRKETQY